MRWIRRTEDRVQRGGGLGEAYFQQWADDDNDDDYYYYLRDSYNTCIM